MIAFTSAKSRLMMPGIVMMSEIPCTPWRRMSSATRKDSKKPASWATASSFSLGMTMVVSTDSINSANAALGLLHAALAFEGERLGDDGDGERAHFAGQRRDDRSGAGAGAAAEAGGDEDHVGAFEGFDDFVGVFERGFAADFGIRAGAQTVGQFDAELNLYRRARHAQRLQIGVGDDEFDAFHAGIDHAVDGVAAAAAHADDLDLGVVAGSSLKLMRMSVFFHKPPRCWFSVFRIPVKLSNQHSAFSTQPLENLLIPAISPMLAEC